MVGGGFRQGLYDVAALAQVMTRLATPGEIPAALGRYQELRLGPAAQHVAISEQATADYLAHAAAGRQ
jgi:2-polyprenyl-6-methoxyphenol hydroxylase-like FAD-dependent oxidoreductase